MKKILIVDDILDKDSKFGQDIIKAGKKIKASFDFIATTEQALEVLKSKSGYYDLVLMDGQFNNCALQGPEAVGEIRKFSSIPIIMISGSAENNKQGVARGADSYVDKDKVLADLNKHNSEIKKALLIGKNRKINKPTQ